MCTQLVRSFVNSRHLVPSIKPFKAYNYFKCGLCGECIREKRSEFALRSYYEAKRCLSRSGGFVLFDTLTYRDESLHWFSDEYPQALGQPWNFYAFSREDFSLFIHNLRKQLKLLGYDVQGNFRYIVTSEYGSDPDGTKRPHLHVLFFSNVPGLLPDILSYLIGEFWPHGRTDGIWYKGRGYLLDQRVFTSLNRDLLKVSNYVSKYVSKDLFLYRSLYRRCVRSMYEVDPDWSRKYSGRLAFRRLCSRVLPFHLQSDGFGLYALDDVPVDEIAADDCLNLPLTRDGLVARIPLPLYYRRKLYYQLARVDGRLSWTLTDFGVAHKLSRLQRDVENFSVRLKAFDVHCDADRLARYNLVRRNLVVSPGDVFCGDLELMSRMLRPLSDLSIDLARLSDRVYFNYSSELHGYSYGRFVTDRELTGVPWFDSCLVRPGRSWSPVEFVGLPPGLRSRRFSSRLPDGLVMLNDPVLDDQLEQFDSWQRLNGDSMDFVRMRQEIQRDRYKSLGLVNEFQV